MKKAYGPPNIEAAGRSKLLYAGLFLVFAAILIWRAPNLLLAPRFWAEEGSVYFQYAYDHSFLRTLCFVYWKVGYIYLIENIATAMAAHLVPLEYAPFATFYTALVVQLIPFLIVLYGKSMLFTSLGKKMAACLILLFLPSLTHHTWLNLLNSQIWFGLIAMLILLENLEGASSSRRWAYRSLLALGGLSGVYVVFLQPVFLFRALVERHKERYIHLGIVTLALLFQIGLALAANSMGVLKHSGQLPPYGQILGDISTQHIGRALLGTLTASRLAKTLGPVGDYLFLILFLATLPITVFNRVKGFLNWKDSRIVMVLTLLVLWMALALTAYRDRSLEVPYAARYTVFSGFALLFLILDNIRPSRRPFISSILALLLVFSIFVGARNYRSRQGFQMDGRYWKPAIEIWRRDPGVALWIPHSRVKLRLTPRYAIKAVNETWRISEGSNQVGEFDRSLLNSSPTLGHRQKSPNEGQ